MPLVRYVAVTSRFRVGYRSWPTPGLGSVPRSTRPARPTGALATARPGPSAGSRAGVAIFHLIGRRSGGGPQIHHSRLQGSARTMRARRRSIARLRAMVVIHPAALPRCASKSAARCHSSMKVSCTTSCASPQSPTILRAAASALRPCSSISIWRTCSSPSARRANKRWSRSRSLSRRGRRPGFTRLDGTRATGTDMGPCSFLYLMLYAAPTVDFLRSVAPDRQSSRRRFERQRKHPVFVEGNLRPGSLRRSGRYARWKRRRQKRRSDEGPRRRRPPGTGGDAHIRRLRDDGLGRLRWLHRDPAARGLGGAGREPVRDHRRRLRDRILVAGNPAHAETGNLGDHPKGQWLTNGLAGQSRRGPPPPKTPTMPAAAAATAHGQRRLRCN